MNAAFVMDASVTVALVLGDEEPSEAFKEAVESSGIVVPAIWPSEVVNAMIMAERRGRLDTREMDKALGLLDRLPIQVEPASLVQVVKDVRPLAERHGLTQYDAAYLEIALRREIPLATIDEDLHRAGRKESVELL